MSSEHTWITANQRLATYFLREHDQAQQGSGKVVWKSLDCLSLKHWVLRAYHSLPSAATRFVLSDHQALVLWESIISRALDTQTEFAFLSAQSLSKTAQAAWHLLQASETPLHFLDHSDSQEVTAFHGWASAFEQDCVQKNCIDFSGCMQIVVSALADKKLKLPAHITLAGFEEIPLQTKQLFSLLSEQCDLIYYKCDQTQQRDIKKLGLDSEDLELQAMAQWAREAQLKNPKALIGCVIPDLSTKRYEVERVFKKIFSPSDAQFNLSGGYPFTHFPLIQTALDILKLGISVLDMSMLGRLLSSPFLGGSEQELIARADLDAQLRKTLEPKIEWHSMQTIARNQGDCATWLMLCEQYFAQFKRCNSKQPIRTWSTYFAAQLQCMGWPGERILNSAEYQQVQRWYLLLEELSGLERVLEKPLSRTQALHHLYGLAQATVFQPQTDNASVQVLGLLEAVGLPFDQLWISDMTQESWPSKASPNPFIPLALQRDRNMPHASAERELAYSRTLTQHFCQSAGTVIFSYALQKEAQVQLPSVLLSEISETSSATFSQQFESVRDAQVAEVVLEYIDDDDAPSLMPEEMLYGGASILKHQAACPFRAFAQIRLGAESISTPEFSMTSQERGNCVHAILEAAWKILGDHQTLCGYEQDALETFLQPIVSKVLNRVASQRKLTLKPNFIALEHRRLLQQVMTWLAFEKKRPPFRVVGIESEQVVQLGGLVLKLRVDREDELEGGARIMIDYKTGTCSAKDWFGVRLDEPQLPLYGMACEHPVRGLAFAQISADKLQFMGISESDYEISGMQAIDQYREAKSQHYTWDTFLADTQVTLTQLALDFQKGHARVDPKQPEKTCRYCDLQGLCRVGEK